MNDKEPAGQLVKSLTESLAKEIKRRPHPLLYVNFGLLATVIFTAGIFYARFNELETQVSRMRATETVAVKVDTLQTQMDSMHADITRLTERLDRVLDRNTRNREALQDDR